MMKSISLLTMVFLPATFLAVRIIYSKRKPFYFHPLQFSATMGRFYCHLSLLETNTVLCQSLFATPGVARADPSQTL
jgi:hypothetical protein